MCCVFFRLTLPKAADLFSAVQPHASGRYLVYAEFCEALAAAALMLHPSPFTPASVRVNDALTKWTVNKAATA